MTSVFEFDVDLVEGHFNPGLSTMNFPTPINNFFKLLAPGLEPLTHGSQVQHSPPTPRGTPNCTVLIQLTRAP